LASAQGFLLPQFNDLTLQIKNQAAAANQLGTSTFTDALSKANQNIQSQFQGITAAAAVSSAEQALSNRVALVGLGGELSSRALKGALTGQNQRNQFNLQNFQNKLAEKAANAKGGFTGGLTGALGGTALGLALAPFTGGLSLGLTGALAAGGGLLGGFGSPGTGGAILNAGSQAFSAGGGFSNPAFSKTSRALPGSTAGALTTSPSLAGFTPGSSFGFNPSFSGLKLF